MDADTFGEDRQAPWERFSDWIHCLSIVTFDLELGQALEVVYPGHAILTEKEKMNICYLAFPDSNSGCMGDTCFHFRMRRFSSKQLRRAHWDFNRTSPVALQVDSGHYYGFVYFRQVVDKSRPRGYLQKSLVLVTALPLVRLFGRVVEIMAPEFFANGEPGLEAACHDLDQWPPPTPGASLQLPLMGSVLQLRLPSRSDPPNLSSPLSTKALLPFPSPVVLSSVHEPQLYESFLPILPHVQLLWELVLLGEPIVVMAPSPTRSSRLVHALVSLIWPLRYCLDYRPFFTIHDSEFKEYTSRTQPPPNVILGVTNPFFTKTLQHWPHIIRLSEEDNGSPGSSQKLRKAGNLRTLDNAPGVYTQYKPFLTRDKTLLKKLKKGAESSRPVEVQDAILRRHFLEITQSFMIPLERYIASLMPLQRQISPFKTAPLARPFDFNEFLGTLDVSGPGLTSGLKGHWLGLYKRFVETRNFGEWLRRREREVEHQLELLHLEVLCSSDFSTTDLRSRKEIEMVDLVLKLQDKMEFVERHEDAIERSLKVKLERQLQAVLAELSEDMRSVLGSNVKLKPVVAAVDT